MEEPDPLVVTDYRLARERFRAAALRAGAAVDTWPVAGTGPAGEALATDVAMLGDADARAVLLVTSGLHGVEGAVGSAVQSAWLERQTGALPHGAQRVVMVHALNPWGFAHGRRTDEANVDLNRNFLLPGEPYAGEAAQLASLASLVAPRSPPSLDLFGLRALALVATRGMATLRHVLTAGQHTRPQGLFFGGVGTRPATRLVQACCTGWLGDAQRVLHLDLHSGLGRYGSVLALALCAPGSGRHQWLRDTFPRTSIDASGEPTLTGNEWRGTIGRWLALNAGAGRERFLHVTLEFGTLAPLAVFAALRAENRAWWQSAAALPAARRRLRLAFAPCSPAWQRDAVRQGVELLQAAVGRWRASGSRPATAR